MGNHEIGYWNIFGNLFLCHCITCDTRWSIEIKPELFNSTGENRLNSYGEIIPTNDARQQIMASHIQMR